MASLPKNTFVRYNQFREDAAGNFTGFVGVDQRKFVALENSLMPSKPPKTEQRILKTVDLPPDSDLAKYGVDDL